MVCRLYPEAANVGWLDGKHTFPKSDSPLDPEVLDALFAHCLHPIHETLGHHTCELCPSWFHRLFGISTWGKRLVGHRNGRRAYLDNG
ncbi:MAG: hypothetical protein M3430_12220 [Acidobacteriota bacterium]|nr:hypothetical protein [Acidobacteriota bacterium]